MQDTNPMNVLPVVPRFQYLPISQPAPLGGSAKNKSNLAALNTSAAGRPGVQVHGLECRGAGPSTKRRSRQARAAMTHARLSPSAPATACLPVAQHLHVVHCMLKYYIRDGKTYDVFFWAYFDMG